MEHHHSFLSSSSPLSPVSQTSSRSTPRSDSQMEANPDSSPATTKDMDPLTSSPASEPQKPSIIIPKIISNLQPPENALDQEIVASLKGKCVDELGNILDGNGAVLGRVEGDLPSMIGRPVQSDGTILDVAGDVAGHVSETLVESNKNADSETSGDRLKIDQDGTIYDQNGKVVGRMKDNLTDGTSQKAPECERCTFRNSTKASTDKGQGDIDAANQAPVTPSPSEIYLDVKSTHDGIQLIIKIPTVLKGDGHETWKCTIEKDD